MKSYKIILSALGLSWMLIRPAYAQDKAARMEKDIDVFEKVLNELFKDDSWTFGSSQQSSGTYVPGYGVIMNVPAGHQVLHAYNYNWSFDMEQDLGELLRESHKSITEAMKGTEKALKESEKALRESEKEMKAAEKEMKQAEKEKKHQKAEKIVIINPPTPPTPPAPPATPRPARAPRAGAYSYSYSYDSDDDNGASRLNDSSEIKNRAYVIGKMEQALEKYGDLLSQLGPDEKIMLVYDRQVSGNDMVYIRHGKEVRARSPRISAEAKKTDIDALQSGKINAKTFRERIKTEASEQKDQDVLDYKVFAGILETVLRNSEETAFRIKGNIRFTSLSGFGVIYNARMRSPYNTSRYDDDDDDDKNVKPSDEVIKQSKAQYEQLEKVLKNTILDYGRTLRSLKDDQFILFNIQLSEQKGIPSSLNVKVKKEVLSKYEKETITRDNALQEIVVSPK